MLNQDTWSLHRRITKTVAYAHLAKAEDAELLAATWRKLKGCVNARTTGPTAIAEFSAEADTITMPALGYTVDVKLIDV